MAVSQLNSVSKFLQKLADMDQAEHATDGDLLARFLVRRDESAFVTLLNRHGPLVLGVSQRILGNTADAEDAFQATFLIFLRNARSIAKRASVSSWLHGVAQRVAVRAKSNGLRRRDFEQKVRTRFDTDALEQAVWGDIGAIIDFEVSRLPKTCRQAFVLCYMQGKSNAEAARLLCCPVGTIQSRLSRSRELLRERLSSRGLALSAGMLATLFVQNRTEAAVPAHVTAAVLRGSKMLTAGNATLAGAVSVQTVALVKGVTSSMMLPRIVLSAAFLLTASLSLGAAVLTARIPGAGTEVATVDPAKDPLVVRPQQVEKPFEDPKVVEAIEAAGGKVHFWSNGGLRWVQVEFFGDSGDDNILRMLQRLRHLESLTLGKNFTDAGLAHLKDIKTIKRLGLIQCQFTDAGLANMKGWTHLESIAFNLIPITGEGLVHLKGLPLNDLLIMGNAQGPCKEFDNSGMAQLPNFPQLESLMILNSEVSDAGLEHLSKMLQLKRILLANNHITDQGLVHLKPLVRGKLERLDISSNQVTDAGLDHLKDLTRLKHLDLVSTQITNDGLLKLRPLTQLTELRLEETAITDAGLANLQPWAGMMEELNLTQTRITDAGLGRLEMFSKLKSLSLGRTGITDIGLAQLKHLSNLQYLSLAGTKVTDAGLVHLQGLTGLKNLSVKNTAVSQAGLDELRKTLREVKIEQ